MEGNYLATPLVTVAGIPHPPPRTNEHESHVLYAAQQLERVTVCEQTVPPTPIVTSVTSNLAQRSVKAHGWDPSQLKSDRIQFRFSDYVDLPIKASKPSVLSPKHERSDSPVFSSKWIEKYQSVQPAVVLAFYAVPEANSAAEEDLAAVLNGLVDELAQSGGSQLMAVLVGDTASLARCLPVLKRETDLKAPEQLLGLPTDAETTETSLIADRIFQAVVGFSDTFFAAKSSAIRTKRQSVAPPLDLLMWDARYTLKLAFMAEFRGDVHGALKLYESAYDSLALLFEKRAITHESLAFANAKQTLDLVALKMLHHSLPLKLAYAKLQQHIRTGTQLRVHNGMSADSPRLLQWQAMQFAVYAQLCTGFPATALSLPGGMPLGLVWLDAAVLYARADELDTEKTSRSDEATQEPSELSPKGCFLTAISELSAYKRSKAYALTQYGDWLALWARRDPESDQSAANEAYRTAQVLLAPSTWPAAEKYLGTKLNDELSLFALNESLKIPEKNGETVLTANDILVSATGNWQSRETHIGRETRAQVTIAPKPVRGELKLDRLVIEHSLGEVEFVGTTDAAVASATNSSEVLAVANRDGESTTIQNLSSTKIFEFALTPQEVGTVELLSVTIYWQDFSQKIRIGRGTNQWTSSSGQIRHLDLVLDPRQVEVTTRPAKLRLTDLTPTTAAIDEQLAAGFDLVSDEDEPVTAQISVYLIQNINEEPEKVHEAELRLIPGQSEGTSARFRAPAALFELQFVVKYTTTKDTLPVSFEYLKEIDVVRPFRVTFDVMPMLCDQAWPAVFAPTLKVGVIPRQWRLTSTCLGTFGDDLQLHAAKLSVTSADAVFEIADGNAENRALEVPYNAVHRLSHTFRATATANTRSFEASARVTLHWSRKTSTDVINELELPAVRLTLPTQEPRVLVVCDEHGKSSATSQVTYHLENASAKLLNFSVQMSSSTYFAYQGPRIAHVTMLPYSTHALTYQLIPLGDATVQNRRPLPDLRVFDVNYKRLLPIAPGDTVVHFEQGALFI